MTDTINKNNIFPLLSAEDAHRFVNSVADALFYEGEYRPSLYDTAFAKAVLQFYTKEGGGLSAERLNEMIYETDVLTEVKAAVNQQQLRSMEKAIEDLLAYRKQEYLSAERAKLNQSIDEMQKLLTVFNDLGSQFQTLDVNEIMRTAAKIAEKDEAALVRAVLDHQDDWG